MIKIRSKRNRRRGLAVQYTGNNLNEIAQFVGREVFVDEVGNLKDKYFTAKKGEYLIKTYYEIEQNRKSLGNLIIVCSQESFKASYRIKE